MIKPPTQSEMTKLLKEAIAEVEKDFGRKLTDEEKATFTAGFTHGITSLVINSVTDAEQVLLSLKKLSS